MPRVLHAMYALGKAGLPPAVEVAGRPYHLVQTVKHDFFAATGFYAAEGESGPSAVLKIGRVVPFCGLPLRWVGRALRDREVRFYTALAGEAGVRGVRGVPPLLGKVGPTGFAHAYVPGRPLSRDRPVPDGFFDELAALAHALHAAGVAYVDLNKPENVLLGTDGRPHLIDFQIAWGRSPALRFAPLRPGNRIVLNLLHRSDLYHVLKHKQRLRPDELTAAERLAARPAWPIRLHRTLTRPYFLVRRRLFRWLRDTGRVVPGGSE